MDFPIIRRPRKPDPTWDAYNNPVTNGFAYRIPHAPERDIPGGGNWVVQKYGGTSVGKFSVKIAEEIIAPGIKSSRLAVVCSARSTGLKADGTTTRLIRASRDALDPKNKKYEGWVDAIREDHIEAGRRDILVKDDDNTILQEYEQAVQHECTDLLQILRSAQVIQEVSNRTKDTIIAVGEKLSCLYMTAVLRSRGVKAVYIDMSEIVNVGSTPPHRRGAGGEGFYDRLSIAMSERILAEEKDVVPVITGFFGKVPNGLLQEIGRGYTDLCAALIGIGLKAAELQIWKEVDGVYTADPNKVPNARLLDSVSPSEAAELTFYGSEVIHNETMEQVIKAEIPIRIKNVKNPRSPGTVVEPDPHDHYNRRPGFVLRHPSNSSVPTAALLSPPRRPTAVTCKKGIAILNVHSKKRTRAHGFLAHIFSTLDKHSLSVDLISSSEVHISLALHSEERLLSGGGEEEMRIESEALRSCVDDLSTLGDIDLVPNMAIVSLVGRHLKKSSGMAGRFFSALGEHDINIEMISQGASEINISCVIDDKDAERALNVVHTHLFTFLDN